MCVIIFGRQMVDLTLKGDITPEHQVGHVKYPKKQTILLFPEDTFSLPKNLYFFPIVKAENKGDIAREGLHPALIPFILILPSFILRKELNKSSWDRGEEGRHWIGGLK